METASSLVQLVQLQLKGCPEATAFYNLRRAFARMCSETGCWRNTLTATVAAIEEVRPSIWRFIWPTMKTATWLSKIAKLRVSKLLADATFGDPSEIDPMLYSAERTDRLRLVFQPGVDIDDGDQVEIDAVLVPNEVGTSLDDIPQSIVELCGEAVVHLAVSMASSMGRRPWTDPALALNSMVEYRRAKRILLMNDLTGGTARATRSVVAGLVE